MLSRACQVFCFVCLFFQEYQRLAKDYACVVLSAVLNENVLSKLVWWDGGWHR